MTDKVYTIIPIFDRRGERAQLYVFAIKWRGAWKAHIREYYPNSKGEPTPGRGTTFTMNMLDDVLYALGLMADDLAAGKLEDDSEGSEANGSEGTNEESKSQGAPSR